MVTHGHRVIAQFVHHLGRDFTLVVSVKQRALKLIPAINQDRIVRPRPRVGNPGNKAGRTTKTLALGVILGTATTVIFADRLEPRMEIVGMQDCQIVIGRGDSSGQAKGSNRRQKTNDHGKNSLFGYLPMIVRRISDGVKGATPRPGGIQA